MGATDVMGNILTVKAYFVTHVVAMASASTYVSTYGQIGYAGYILCY
jgi:hypothetical protein